MATWNDVTWSSGDVVELTKMNNLLNNAIYVKDEGQKYRTLMAGSIVGYNSAQPLASEGTDVVRVFLNATGVTNIGTFTDSTAKIGPVDLVAEGATPGLNTIILRLNKGSSISPEYIYRTYRFVMTDQTNYLTMWGDVTSIDVTKVLREFGADITIIAHSENEGI